MSQPCIKMDHDWEMIPEESYYSVNRYRCRGCGLWAYRHFSREFHGGKLKLGPFKVYVDYKPSSAHTATRLSRDDPEMLVVTPNLLTERKRDWPWW